MSTATAVRKAESAVASTVTNFRLVSWKLSDTEVLIKYHWPVPNYDNIPTESCMENSNVELHYY